MKDQVTKLSGSRWRAPLLWIVLGSFAFGILSGFGLFFLRPYLGAKTVVASAHWIGSLVTTFPYVYYQFLHYRRVRRFHAQLHYRIGLGTLFAWVVMVISGALLIQFGEAPISASINLVHILSSFAFTVFIAGHLVLVARLALIRREQLPSKN
jgi:hypothetical protein